MSDVFLSYAREDAKVAKRVADRLEREGWDVWWDQDLYAGTRWEETILGALEAAKAVVGIWSANAAGSEWVAREMHAALAAEKLVPCSADGASPPPPFDQLELAGWPASRAHGELRALLGGIERLAPPSRYDVVRPGFDFGFLGLDIEFPEIPGVGDELPYQHFSVLMNPARRLPWCVAYNVEPQSYVPARSSRWEPDPMISPLFQPSDAHFRGTGFDRGHLAAAKTVAWGPSRHATIAMQQAFYWTNMAPQTADVNQFSWNALEQQERALALERGRVIGFSGPVLRADDPAHVVTDEVRGRVRARQTFHTPRRFFKVTVVPGAQAGQVLIAAFVVANERGHAPATPVSIEALELETGLRFPDVIRKAARLDA
ncbi:DNA/RNA non-specific endonuclease [Solirubrobacter taibaiensis]|nr:DNA/RNA non-specific endonuclease [Solirubrobacter taibaiensis]